MHERPNRRRQRAEGVTRNDEETLNMAIGLPAAREGQ
jgi:hypothetical protein